MKKKIFLLGIILSFITLSVFAQTSPTPPQAPKGPTPKEQCEQNGINYDNALKFVERIKKYIRKDKVEALSAVISFPVRINRTRDEKSYYIKNSEQFSKKYSLIFNKSMKAAIAADDGPIFCNYQGAMIAAGKIWFSPIDNSTPPQDSTIINPNKNTPNKQDKQNSQTMKIIAIVQLDPELDE